jgi:membrane protein DedA with SNARE-associated domain
MEFINLLWPYVSNNPYFFLFFGMIIGGETFLLPAVYLATRGDFPFSHIIILSSIATLISDTAWYSIGWFFPLERILSWKTFSKKREVSIKIFSVFQKHGSKLLYISKFVYGTRTLAQVLAGSIRMPFVTYSVVNLAGILSYLLVIIGAAILTKESLASFGQISYNEYVSVLAFIAVISIIHICLKKWLGKKFTASSSQPGMKNEQ